MTQLVLACCLVIVSWSLPAHSAEVPRSRAEISLSFAPVVRKAAPAVVNIFTTRIVRQRPISPLFDDPFFRRFFGDRFGLPEQQRRQNSLGSGVILSEDGLIVTNHHVIEGAEEIKVVLSDRREFAAQLVLDDERTDLAVLRIDAGGEKLPALELRDSDSVEVGDLVLAIGNPFGVGQTVTSGIVSALARTHVGIGDLDFFIQTDAAINPGNSGGALVTMDGRLVGINSAIYSRGGGSIGIGFAVPSNMVRSVLASVGEGDRVVRPWPGFSGQSVGPDLALGFGLDRPGGVVVKRLFPGGPADWAGLQVGDVVLAVEGRPVDDVKALQFRIATGVAGGSVSLQVWRARRQLELTLPLEPAPEHPPRDLRVLEGANPLAGAEVANLSPALAEELELGDQWEGVVVTRVLRGSPAAGLRLRTGDVIAKVNRRAISSTKDLASALRHRVSRWLLEIRREGQTLRLELAA